MWYKIVKNNIIIDILKTIIYVKQLSNHAKIICNEQEGEMILASDHSICYPLNEIEIIQISQEDYQALTAKIIPIETSNEETISRINTIIKNYDQMHKDTVYRYDIQSTAQLKNLKQYIRNLELANQNLSEQNEILQQRLETVISDREELIQGLLEISSIIYA